jgi:long-chain acyl-CoA synthetase
MAAMNVADFISDNAQRQGKRTALAFRDSKLSYQELEERILKCAQGLSERGVTKGSTFALVLRNCPEFVILSMALARLGAVVVPINFLEKADRLQLILTDAGAQGIVTSKEFLRQVKTAVEKVPSLTLRFLREGEQDGFLDIKTVLESAPLAATPAVNENDLMMLLYTSGTTGQPKGVMLTHKNFIANVEQCLQGIELSEHDRFLCLLPLFHAFSWTTCLLIPMRLGAMTVIIESLLPFDPVIKAIWHHKVTLFVAVPQIYAALTARVTGAKAFLLRLLNPVRACICGAAPLPDHVRSAFEKTFAVPFLEGYGLTEAAPVVTMNRMKKRKPHTVGPALPGVEISLRTDDGAPVLKQGDVGEIWIKGDNVMKGYYKKPQESKDAFSSDGWLKTGDMGRFDEDLYLCIVDRKKDLIIVKGLNVYPQEVENVIIQDPGVQEVAVVGKVNPADGDEIIRAFVTIKEGRTVEKSKLFELCRAQLAAYKIPKEIIVIDEMPKNALQKILKKDLRQRP